MGLNSPGLSRNRGNGGKFVQGLAARQAAAVLLEGVTVEHHPLRLDETLSEALEANDRGLARAIAAMAIRRHGQIRDALSGLMAKPLGARAGRLPIILEIAAAQILFMDVPDHAAVSVAMEAAETDPKARHFKPLANGVLRALIRGRDEILARQDAAALNTPQWLYRRWIAAYGVDTAREIANANLAEAPLDLTVKDDAAAWAERLGGVVLPTGTVRLEARGRIEALPGYDDGDWWVQDVAASLPARLLGDVAGKSVLDLCAAPGGKTAQIAVAGGKVTAIDAAADRVDRLRTNLARLGLEVDCVVADALTYAPDGAFDAVLLDAPCSATGTIRRHPDIPWLKRDTDIAAMARLQGELLARAAALVRPGGTLVFATCSLEPEEGEAHAQAASALPLEPMPIAEGEIPGLAGDWIRGGMLRTLPHHPAAPGIAGGMDGFFAARFRRI